MNLERYFNRIQYKGKTDPEIEVLNALQLHHLLHIPFENLDIHYGNPINLNLDKIYDKVITQKRGGFCYELNGLFFLLLKKLGFNAKRVSARVYSNKEKSYGEEFDHLAIIVEIVQKEYLVDVGFGEFVFKPLSFEINNEQRDERGTFIIENHENDYYRVSQITENEKLPTYIFTKTHRKFEDFQEMCEYHQSSPDSSFTQKRLISKPTQNGRITISGDSLKITEGGKIIQQQQFDNEADYAENLLKYFDINEPDIKKY